MFFPPQATGYFVAIFIAPLLPCLVWVPLYSRAVQRKELSDALRAVHRADGAALRACAARLLGPQPEEDPLDFPLLRVEEKAVLLLPGGRGPLTDVPENGADSSRQALQRQLSVRSFRSEGARRRGAGGSRALQYPTVQRITSSELQPWTPGSARSRRNMQQQRWSAVSFSDDSTPRGAASPPHSPLLRAASSSISNTSKREKASAAGGELPQPKTNGAAEAPAAGTGDDGREGEDAVGRADERTALGEVAALGALLGPGWTVEIASAVPPALVNDGRAAAEHEKEDAAADQGETASATPRLQQLQLGLQLQRGRHSKKRQVALDEISSLRSPAARLVASGPRRIGTGKRARSRRQGDALSDTGPGGSSHDDGGEATPVSPRTPGGRGRGQSAWGALSQRTMTLLGRGRSFRGVSTVPNLLAEVASPRGDPQRVRSVSPNVVLGGDVSRPTSGRRRRQLQPDADGASSEVSDTLSPQRRGATARGAALELPLKQAAGNGPLRLRVPPRAAAAPKAGSSSSFQFSPRSVDIDSVAVEIVVSKRHASKRAPAAAARSGRREKAADGESFSDGGPSAQVPMRRAKTHGELSTASVPTSADGKKRTESPNLQTTPLSTTTTKQQSGSLGALLQLRSRTGRRRRHGVLPPFLDAHSCCLLTAACCVQPSARRDAHCFLAADSHTHPIEAAPDHWFPRGLIRKLRGRFRRLAARASVASRRRALLAAALAHLAAELLPQPPLAVEAEERRQKRRPVAAGHHCAASRAGAEARAHPSGYPARSGHGGGVAVHPVGGGRWWRWRSCRSDGGSRRGGRRRCCCGGGGHHVAAPAIAPQDVRQLRRCVRHLHGVWCAAVTPWNQPRVPFL